MSFQIPDTTHGTAMGLADQLTPNHLNGGKYAIHGVSGNDGNITSQILATSQCQSVMPLRSPLGVSSSVQMYVRTNQTSSEQVLHRTNPCPLASGSLPLDLIISDLFSMQHLRQHCNMPHGVTDFPIAPQAPHTFFTSFHHSARRNGHGPAM